MNFDGRRARPWRTVFAGPEPDARQRYLREHAQLKQGHLMLVDTGGKLCCHQWAGWLNR